MNKLDIVKKYLHCLANADAEGAAALFTENGAMDDADGHHRLGHAGVKAVIGTVLKGMYVDAPRHWIEEGNRLIAYGILGGGGRFGNNPVKIRWVFHFEGDKIAHLTNSFVTVWDGPQ